MPFPSMPRIGEFGCLKIKLVGKSNTGALQARFDEEERDILLWKILNEHEGGNGGYSQEST